MPHSTHPTTPIALTIAGSDSGGGAGIQADLKAFSALGVYGASVITAITAQNTVAVTAVHGIPTDVVLAQIAAVLDDLNVAAVKIGMLATPEIIQTVAHGLERFTGPIILDPVMVAKSGDKLLQQNAIDCLKDNLIPRATLLTPNLPEAATLLSGQDATNTDEMQRQGEELMALGAQSVLMKGGHAEGAECIDLLLHSQGMTHTFSAPRIETVNTHGTGCTLSASIAANMAKGLSLTAAVEQAHRYLHQAICHADDLDIGHGHGPVHHFHQLWK